MRAFLGRHGGAVLILLATLFAAAPARAQGPYSADDVRAGGVMFGQLCVTCHGFNGTGGMGPPLTRPKLLNAPDDAALRAIISDGIPDRGMPRVRRTTPDELRQIVAYVRSLGATTPAPISGNPTRGAQIYASSGCATCHMVRGEGGVLGPVLTDIGYLRGAPYLREALVNPGAVLPKGTLPIPSRGYQEYLPVRVVAADGRVVRGVRLNEDVFTIQCATRRAASTRSGRARRRRFRRKRGSA